MLRANAEAAVTQEIQEQELEIQDEEIEARIQNEMSFRREELYESLDPEDVQAIQEHQERVQVIYQQQEVILQSQQQRSQLWYDSLFLIRKHIKRSFCIPPKFQVCVAFPPVQHEREKISRIPRWQNEAPDAT